MIAAENQQDALLQLHDALERPEGCIHGSHGSWTAGFGGLTEQETAKALEVTTRIVQRDWVNAGVFLRRLLAC